MGLKTENLEQSFSYEKLNNGTFFKKIFVAVQDRNPCRFGVDKAF